MGARRGITLPEGSNIPKFRDSSNRLRERISRQSASRSLCGCIQNVADVVLTYGDQRRAAKFFTNPQQAQDVRQSDRAADEAFWLRYKSFGDHAESYCAEG